MNQLSKKLLLSAFIAVCALGTTLSKPAFASGHMEFEIGAGTQSNFEGSGMNLLLRIGAGYAKHPEDAPDPDGIEKLVIAHISGDMAVDVNARGAAALPYVSFDFLPLHDKLAVVSETGNLITADIRILPIHIQRVVQIDQNVEVKASLVGIQVGGAWPQSDTIALFAQVAVDALAYKYVQHVTDSPSFHGAGLIGLEAEGGAAFEINSNFKISVSIGASSDINFGSAGGFAVQSDMSAYGAVKFDIYRMLQFFVKAGYFGDCTSSREDGCEGAPTFMTGATVHF